MWHVGGEMTTCETLGGGGGGGGGVPEDLRRETCGGRAERPAKPRGKGSAGAEGGGSLTHVRGQNPQPELQPVRGGGAVGSRAPSGTTASTTASTTAIALVVVNRCE